MRRRRIYYAAQKCAEDEFTTQRKRAQKANLLRSAKGRRIRIIQIAHIIHVEVGASLDSVRNEILESFACLSL